MKRLLSLVLLSAPLAADLKVDVYGYVKLDAEYNSKNTGSLPSPSPTSVPLNSDKAAQHGEFLMDARESRIGVKATDSWEEIQFLGIVEADFFTTGGTALTGNGRFLRLRLAYARADMPCGFFFLAGQYWSLMMNAFIAQPNLVDFNGPVGAVFARQPQFRVGYFKELCDCWGKITFEADIEKQSLNTLGVINSESATDTAQGSGQKFPLFIGKVVWQPENFSWELAGGVSKAYVVPTPTSSQVSKTVWGVQSSAQYTWCSFSPYISTHYFDGVSRLDGGNYLDAVLVNSDLKPVRSYGFYAGLSYKICDRTSFNTVYGWERANPIDNSTFSGTTYKKYQSFHINVLHQFWKRWQTGLELERFANVAFNGQKGDVNIVHMGIWFFF